MTYGNILVNIILCYAIHPTATFLFCVYFFPVSFPLKISEDSKKKFLKSIFFKSQRLPVVQSLSLVCVAECSTGSRSRLRQKAAQKSKADER